MALNFPNSPSLNDTHTVGGITYTWNGSAWDGSVDRLLHIGRRSGSFNLNLSGSSFIVNGRTQNISINI